MKAYVLIKVRAGEVKDVVAQLRTVGGRDRSAHDLRALRRGRRG